MSVRGVVAWRLAGKVPVSCLALVVQTAGFLLNGTGIRLSIQQYETPNSLPFKLSPKIESHLLNSILPVYFLIASP